MLDASAIPEEPSISHHPDQTPRRPIYAGSSLGVPPRLPTPCFPCPASPLPSFPSHTQSPDALTELLPFPLGCFFKVKSETEASEWLRRGKDLDLEGLALGLGGHPLLMGPLPPLRSNWGTRRARTAAGPLCSGGMGLRNVKWSKSFHRQVHGLLRLESQGSEAGACGPREEGRGLPISG